MLEDLTHDEEYSGKSPSEVRFDSCISEDPQKNYSTTPTKRQCERYISVSGLPWTCHNCGISFFSLRTVTEDECYCSGECKWSVILYREMDERMDMMEGKIFETEMGYSSCSTLERS